MVLTEILCALFANLIVNVTVFPAVGRRYPASTTLLNIVSATLNTASTLIPVLLYKSKDAILLATPWASDGRRRISFLVAAVAAVASTFAMIYTAYRSAGGLRIFAIVVAALGLLAVLRVIAALRSSGTTGMTLSG